MPYQYNSYNTISSEQSLQTSPVYKYNSQYEQSPFKRNLAVIPESSAGEERRAYLQNSDGVIQYGEFQCQSYQSLLYESGKMNKHQSGQIVPLFVSNSPRNQKSLLDQLFMIRNTNECLRETIKQGNIEKNQLVEEIQALREQNKQYKQHIIKLQEDLSKANQQLIQLSQPQQQQKYFTQNHIMPKSQHQLIQQNSSLQSSIQEIKKMYQREIDVMMMKHDSDVVDLETKWSRLVKQKDVLIKEMERRLGQRQQEIKIRVHEHREEVERVKLQKKEILREYLQTVQIMRGQLRENLAKGQMRESMDAIKIREISNISSDPILISEPMLVYTEQPTRDNIAVEETSISSRLEQLTRENQLLKSIIINNNKNSNSNNNNNNKASQSHHPQTITQPYQSPANIIINQSEFLSKVNSISSLKPILDINTTGYVVPQRLNQTMVYDQNCSVKRGNYHFCYLQGNNIDQSINNNNNSFNHRTLSKQRSNSQHRNPSKLSHLYNPKPTPNSLILPNSYSTYTNTNSLNSKLFRDIDNKLDQIKYQINKQITY